MTEVELLVDDAGSPAKEPHAPVGGRRALAVLIGALGLVALGLLWVGPGGDDSSPDDTSLDGTGLANTALADVDGSTTPTPVPSTTTTLESTTTIAPAGGFIEGEGPALQTVVGYELWFGGDSSIRRLDLDTGDMLSLGFSGYPVIGDDDYIVAFDLVRRGYSVIDRADPLAEPRLLQVADGFSIDSIAPSPQPGTAWVVDRSSDRYDWRLLSLRTGAPLRSTTTESLTTSQIAFGFDLAVGPEIDERDGTLYVLSGTGHEEWVSGAVVVRDSFRALIERCDGSECRRAWYDLATLEELDLPTPTELLEHTELLGRGSWIHERTTAAETSRLVDITGEVRFDTTEGVPRRGFDVAPDGRWAALTNGQQLRVMDLTTGELTVIRRATNRVGTSSSVVWVETAR